MIKITFPIDFDEIEICREQTLCLVIALRHLNTEPKELTDKTINTLIDASWKQYTRFKNYPDYSITYNVREMHSIIFNQLIQLMNPTDLANIISLSISDLYQTTEDLLEAEIKFIFLRGENHYSYTFRVSYNQHCRLQFILKAMQPAPRKMQPHSRKHHRHSAMIGVISMPNIEPQPPPPDYESHLQMHSASQKHQWNLSAMSPDIRKVCHTFARIGLVPPEKFLEIEATYMAALNPYNPDHRQLQQICNKDRPCFKDVSDLLQHLRLIITNRRADAFKLAA